MNRKYPAHPETLYKYRAFNDYSLRLLSHNEVFFAAPKDLNDPLDCAIPVRYDMGTLKQMYYKNLAMLQEVAPSMGRKERKLRAMKMAETIYANRDDQQKKEEYYSDIKEDINNGYGILSLSACKEVALMWSHYSAGHQGFCVGFNTERLLEFREELTNKYIFTLFKRVDYYEQLPILNPYKMTDEQIFLALLFSKTSDWSYEQEYRFVRGKFAGIGPNSIVSLRADVIESVTLGTRCSPENREKIKDILRSRQDRITLHQAKQAVGYSTLAFEPISY